MEAIDFNVRILLRRIEHTIDYHFKSPKLLWKALQFPDSRVRWNDPKDNTGLRRVGGFVIQLTAAAGEYYYCGLSDPNFFETTPDGNWLTNADWFANVVWQRGEDMGLLRLIGSGDDQAHQRSDDDLRMLRLTTTAIVGALYIDGGMDAAAKVLGDSVDYANS